MVPGSRLIDDVSAESAYGPMSLSAVTAIEAGADTDVGSPPMLPPSLRSI